MQPGYMMAQPGMMMAQPGMVVMAQPAACYVQGFVPTNPTAYALFCAVDTNRSGSVDFRELHMALSNGGYTQFSIKTTKLLIRMFDVDRSAGSLGYSEFERLLTQLQGWRQWFDAADRDRSGKLNVGEMAGCLRSFGFNLPEPLMHMIFNAYDADASGSLTFDEFVQVLAEVNALTAHFRRYDPMGSGRATLDYTTFMSIVFMTRS